MLSFLNARHFVHSQDAAEDARLKKQEFATWNNLLDPQQQKHAITSGLAMAEIIREENGLSEPDVEKTSSTSIIEKVEVKRIKVTIPLKEFRKSFKKARNYSISSARLIFNINCAIFILFLFLLCVSGEMWQDCKRSDRDDDSESFSRHSVWRGLVQVDLQHIERSSRTRRCQGDPGYEGFGREDERGE